MDDPVLEAHRIVWEAQGRVPLGERAAYATSRLRRDVRDAARGVRGWWVTADLPQRQLVWTLAAVALSEVVAAIVRPERGGGGGGWW